MSDCQGSSAWQSEKPIRCPRSTLRLFSLSIILTILCLKGLQADPRQGELLTKRLEYGRRLKVALPANGRETAAVTARPRKHSNGFRHSRLHSSRFRNDTTRLWKLVAGADIAVARLVNHVRSSNQSQHLSPETLSLLHQVGIALEDSVQNPQPAPINIMSQGAAKLSVRYPDYRLSKERIQRIAAERDGVVMVTWANFNYLDFVQNWILHLKQINVTTYMIGTIDEKLLKALSAIGEKNVFVIDPIVKGEDVSFGSSEFIAMGRQHCLLIEELTGLGVDVLVSDIDTVWLRDPFPYLALYPAADILVSSDALVASRSGARPTTKGENEWQNKCVQYNTSTTDELETYSGHENIGIVLFRKTAHEFAKELSFRMANDEKLWEQHALVELLNRNASQHGVRKDRLFRGYNGSYLIGTLPVALFANGHTYFTQNLADVMGIGPPYVVHNTHQFSFKQGKRHRFQERHLWLVDPDEYYNPPGGLLSFDLHVEGFLEPASHLDLGKSELEDVMPHFQLVHHQLRQAQTAGGRPFMEDRYFQARRCNCLDKFPQTSSLSLDHTERARCVGDRRVLSQCPSCGSKATYAIEDEGGAHGSGDQHDLQGSTQECKLQDYEAVKLLHFSDMRESFGGFQSEAMAKSFEEQTQSYASLFCCADAHPGHVWYDMWWDKEDHINRHGELVHQWKPMFGP